MKNIVLIGMPGAGKSTVGVILAKTLGRSFVDTDIVIQEHEGLLLQELIDRYGTGVFLHAEEEAVLSLRCRNAVIATGGSVVFSRRAMEHLGARGIIVYLKISCDEMERRIRNITTRGIILKKGESLREMYNDRVLLYERYADITADCTEMGFEDCMAFIIEELNKRMDESP